MKSYKRQLNTAVDNCMKQIQNLEFEITKTSAMVGQQLDCNYYDEIIVILKFNLKAMHYVLRLIGEEK